MCIAVKHRKKNKLELYFDEMMGKNNFLKNQKNLGAREKTRLRGPRLSIFIDEGKKRGRKKK